MEKISIKNKEVNTNDFNKIVEYLKKGKVIVYPTDTIYGLGCMATDKKAVEKIYKIKKRERNRPLIILVSSLAMLKKYCFVSKEQEKVLKEFWEIKPVETIKNKTPQPLPLIGGHAFRKGEKYRAVTVILKSRNVLPREVSGGMDTLAVRLPRNDFLIRIIRKIGAPLVSTSVNLSAEKNIERVDKLDHYFKGERPDLIVDAGTLKGRPSKLFDLIDVKDIKILRK